MTPDERERIAGIVDVLLGTPPERRPAALDALCIAGEDDEVRSQVEQLLQADDQLEGQLKAMDRSGDGATEPILEEPAEPAAPPAVIGRYHLQARLGGGGMGEVFRAEQRSPIRRTVAVKLIKPGFDTHEVIARFEAERQALARMDHPNIARVLDAGATDTGRPYFVMEFVPGTPLTAFADDRRLTIRQRLALFAEVCDAVAHAHTKGVIHRDIKPSNVLALIGDDGAPHVKVIDFGIAKALDDGGRLGDRTYLTSLGMVLGTYEYMSPEQAAGSPDVDTRSDVYSLGVLLYELLAGVRPFERSELARRADEELRRVIREVEPPRPSTRFSQLVGKATSDERRATSGDERTANLDLPPTTHDQRPTVQSIADARLTEPRTLVRLLARELEWIPLKALRKDASRRYVGPAEMAADVRSYLDGQPLSAAPESRVYLARKFAWRHRAALVAVAALFLLITAGVMFYIRGIRAEQRRTLAALNDAEVQRREATAQRDAAKKSEAIASAVSDFQSQMLAAADPLQGKGDQVTVVEMLDAATKELGSGSVRTQPLVEARLQQIMGQTYWSLARFTIAEPLLRAALETHKKELRPEDDRIDEDLAMLGEVLRSQQRYAEVAVLYREAVDRAVIYRGATSWDALLARVRLVNALVDINQYAEADAVHRQAAADISKNPAIDDNCRAELAMSGGKVAIGLNRFAEAEAYWREAVKIRKRQTPPDHFAIAMPLHLVGTALAQQNRYAEADEFFRESIAEYRSVPGDNPFVGTVFRSLARSLIAQKKYQEGETASRELLAIRLRSYPPEHPRVCESKRLLAECCTGLGKHDEAVLLLNEVVAAVRLNQPARRIDLFNALSQLALALKAKGDLPGADSAAAEAAKLRGEIGTTQPATR